VAAAEARRILVLNLIAQPGETSGFSPESHLDVMAAGFPDVRFDSVVADPDHVPDVRRLREACRAVGAELVLRPVADARAEPGHHDPLLLGRSLGELIGHGSIPAWR
jgi:2-phospho-L-lactate transferase/gluconeogenesis factor (CofD/UPF0052 family)